MFSPEEHGGRVRQGLRRAVLQGAALGGLRPATEQKNAAAHAKALRQAMDYRAVLEAGRDKSLSALSRDLFAAGCRTGSGKPLSSEMVRRLRVRLDEAQLAIAAGDLEGEWAEWQPFRELRAAAREKNDLAFHWLLKMARKEYGSPFVDRLLQRLLVSDQAEWVRAALGGP
jgi:hypothetical protein